ncbi:MAG TPA: tetratricopeptide repeat protein [Vicinamibacteria bacterium]|nr:tetratricopeptide repeat protein [Vicinamibacteria bacterium]
MALSLVLAAAHRLPAHEDPHHRIEALTKQIAERPGDHELYLKRGALHRVASHWDLALADFERALVLEPGLETVAYYRGRVLLDAGRFAEAEATLDAFLEERADHVEALIARARARRKLGKPLGAVDDYDRVLALVGRSAPDIHVERAAALAESGPGHLETALFGLDEAIRDLGPLIVLESKAIEVLLSMRDYDAALERIARLVDRLPRKEAWLLRRGEVLERAGRSGQARASFEAALLAIESLPAHLRQVPMSRDLELRLRVLLHREDQ